MPWEGWAMLVFGVGIGYIIGMFKALVMAQEGCKMSKTGKPYCPVAQPPEL